jgi:hypothetical protein
MTAKKQPEPLLHTSEIALGRVDTLNAGARRRRRCLSGARADVPLCALGQR